MDHLNEENIRYSEFFVTHREFFKRLLLFTFFFLDIVIIVNLAFRFIVYNQGIVAQIETENSLAVSYIPFDQLREQFASKPLEVNSVTVVPVGFQEYDVVAKLHNPNPKWLAKKVSVNVTFDGKAQEPRETFILPDSDQYISVFNLRSASASPQARVELVETQWSRVRDTSPLSIPTQINFEPAEFRNNPGEGFQVDAVLINNSLFGFWQMGVHVLALRQGRTIGVNYITLENVRTGAVRDFSVVWPRNLVSPEQVLFIPSVNVYDQSIYMPFSSNSATGDPSGLD